MSELRNNPEVQAALAACSVSVKAFCQLLMPDHFYAPFSKQHDAICSALEDPEVKKINIIASRGFGKTSLVCNGLAGQSILFRKRSFVVYVTNSSSIAIEKTENLKRTLSGDKMIRSLFGSIKTSQIDSPEMDETFTKTSWVAHGNTLILPRGAHQQIRGLLFGRHRPDLIIIDDLENTNNVQNEEQREKLWEWFLGDVDKCVSRYDQNFKIVYIDTVKHEDSIPVRLKELPDWKTLEFPICEEGKDGKFESLVPELISSGQMQKEWESAMAGATEDVFYREYMCLPQSSKTGAFRRDYFKYYDEMDLREKTRDLHNIVLVDPAKTANPGSAETAIVGCGAHLSNQAVYVRDVVHGRFQPDESAREALAMAERIGADVIGWETSGLGGYALWPTQNLIKMSKSRVRLIELKARRGILEKGKIERIRTLVPLYRQGLIYHNKSCCAPLEAQLTSFPKSKRWDIMDALAYVIEAMDQAEIFFYPDGYDNTDKDVIEQEFEEFDKEDLSESAYDVPCESRV